MSKSTSILMKEMTYSRAKIRTLIKSLKHSLRIKYQQKNYNYDFSKSGENILNFRKSEEVIETYFGKNLTDEDLEFYLKELTEMLIIEEEAENRIDPKTLLTVKRDFRRFLASDEKDLTSPSKAEAKKYSKEQRLRRKELTTKVLNHLSTGLKGNVLTDRELEEYAKLTKKNRIERIEIFKDKTQDKITNNTIQAFECFFKIPVDNNIEFSARESKIIIEDFYKENFPMYNIIATFEHNDEINERVMVDNQYNVSIKKGGNHTHAFISSKNKFTGNYDYTKQKYNYVKNELFKELKELKTRDDFSKWYFDNHFEFEYIPEGFLNLKTDEERVFYLIGEETKTAGAIQQLRLGAIYQNAIYKFCNNHPIFKEKDIEGIKFINMGNTREEIFAKKRRFSEEDKNGLNKEVNTGYQLNKENLEKIAEITKNKLLNLEKIDEETKNKLLKNTTLENEAADYENLISETKEEGLKELNKENEKTIKSLNEKKQELKDYELNVDKRKANYLKAEQIKALNEIKEYKEALKEELKEISKKVEGYKETIKTPNYKSYEDYNDLKDYVDLNTEIINQAKQDAFNKHYEEIEVDEVRIKKIKDYDGMLSNKSKDVLGLNSEIEKLNKNKLSSEIILSANQDTIKEINLFKQVMNNGKFKDIKNFDKLPEEQKQKSLNILYNSYAEFEKIKKSQEEVIAEKVAKELNNQKEIIINKTKEETKAFYIDKVKKLEIIEKSFEEVKTTNGTLLNFHKVNEIKDVFDLFNQKITDNEKFKTDNISKNIIIENQEKIIISNKTEIDLKNAEIKGLGVENTTNEETIKELNKSVKTLNLEVETLKETVIEYENAFEYLYHTYNDFKNNVIVNFEDVKNKGKDIFNSFKSNLRMFKTNKRMDEANESREETKEIIDTLHKRYGDKPLIEKVRAIKIKKK